MIYQFLQFALGVVSGVLATIVTEFLWRPIATATLRFQKYRELRLYAARSSTPHYVPLRVASANDARREFDLSQLARLVSNESSEPPLILITSEFGMGKTTLARQFMKLLAGCNPVGRRRLPIYANGSAFRSGRVIPEITEQLQDIDDSISRDDVVLLLKSDSTVLLLDALDQLPSSPLEDILSELLAFIETGRRDDSVRSAVVPLVRLEYCKATQPQRNGSLRIGRSRTSRWASTTSNSRTISHPSRVAPRGQIL